MEKVEEFLTLFKELEKEMGGIANTNDNYVSFSRALNDIYHNKKHPVLSSYDNYSFLRTASDIRNILSHENEACIPTDKMIEGLRSILEQIKNPRTIFDICTKDVVTADDDDLVKDVMFLMDDKGLSHVPILDEKRRVKGVFSRSSLFDFLLDGNSVSEDCKISDFKSVTSIYSHHNESYLFARKGAQIDAIFDYMSKRKAHQKAVAAVLVTENGKISEMLLGIVTLSDLASEYKKQ